MRINFNKNAITVFRAWFNKASGGFWVTVLATLAATLATTFSYLNDYVVRYGDSESHLNIAKRVVDSITPGFAQLGGIWLPVPHLLMVPFVSIDVLWRTGLAGSIVSGLAFVVAALYLYRTTHLLTGSRAGSMVAALVFILNPNILYLQSTPMTEVVLIAFFALSTFYFIRFMKGQNQLYSLLLAALFGFFAVLTRYDGWFLVGVQAGCIFLYYYPWSKLPKNFMEARNFFRTETWKTAEGHIVLFSTLAFLGIAIWLAWDFLILGDPLYFTHSEFSAKSQQNEWLARGQLPAYHNLALSFLYYLVTVMANTGLLVFAMGIAGLFYYLLNRGEKNRYLVALVLAVPFFFNVVTQYIGQSVIFIPDLTPVGFDWSLFNVRYGVMSAPLIAILVGYMFYRVRLSGRIMISVLLLVQITLFQVGYSRVISWEDGVIGLSSAKRPEAERWIKANYDYGMLLMDDYARTVSVVRSGVPMESMIYIGNKPYWEESLVEPEKYARWIVMQQNDSVWKELWSNPVKQARLYKYFEKAYTSPEILIFRRQDTNVAEQTTKFWNFQCLDTMKYSRDMAREYAARLDLADFANREMELIKESGASCVSIGTPYDEEFAPYLTAWVKAAREKGLAIWFRGNMSGWEGWFDYPKFTSTEEHHAGIRKFITSHPELFRAGDIFTPAPEPENGMIGDPRRSQANYDSFHAFLPKSYETCLNSFIEAGIADVTCGYYSLNGDVANEVMTKELLVEIGDVLVIDHHVETPERLVSDIQALHEKFGSSIVLGEFGAPIYDIHGQMTDVEQAQFVTSVMKALYNQQDLILGLNYWVLRGGSTGLVDESTGAPKLAYESLRSYLRPASVKGRVVNSIGEPVQDVRVVSEEYSLETRTNVLGEYMMYAPAVSLSLAVDDENWVAGDVARISLVSGRESTQEFQVEPVRKSLWYKFRLWLKK